MKEQGQHNYIYRNELDRRSCASDSDKEYGSDNRWPTVGPIALRSENFRSVKFVIPVLIFCGMELGWWRTLTVTNHGLRNGEQFVG